MATPGMEHGSGTEVTRSVHRALAVLETLAARPHGVTPKELSQALGIHLSTSYRLLNTLMAAGYAARSPSSGLFRLGPRVAYLHHGYLAALSPPEETLAFVHALQLATGETVMPTQLEGDDVVVSAVVAGSRPAAYTPGYVGMTAPAHVLAVGRVLLAWQPSAQIEAYLARHVATPAVPPFPPLVPDTLRAELARIRRAGYALDPGEGDRGVCCFAAPISDPTGAVDSAISIVGPCTRFHREESTFVALSREVARAIGAVRGDSGRRPERDGADRTEPETTTQAAIAAQLALVAEAMSRVSTAPPVSARAGTHREQEVQ